MGLSILLHRIVSRSWTQSWRVWLLSPTKWRASWNKRRRSSSFCLHSLPVYWQRRNSVSRKCLSSTQSYRYCWCIIHERGGKRMVPSVNICVLPCTVVCIGVCGMCAIVRMHICRWNFVYMHCSYILRLRGEQVLKVFSGRHRTYCSSVGYVCQGVVVIMWHHVCLFITQGLEQRDGDFALLGTYTYSTEHWQYAYNIACTYVRIFLLKLGYTYSSTHMYAHLRTYTRVCIDACQGVLLYGILFCDSESENYAVVDLHLLNRIIVGFQQHSLHYGMVCHCMSCTVM